MRVQLSLSPWTNQFGDAIITITATDRGGLSSSRYFVATVTPVNAPPVITAAESLLAGQLELELRAGPDTAWRLEASRDLKNWIDYPLSATQMRAGTNGVCWIQIDSSEANQFFRAKQVP